MDALEGFPKLVNLAKIELPEPTGDWDKVLDRGDELEIGVLCMSIKDYAYSAFMNPIQAESYIANFPGLMNQGFFKADFSQDEEIVYIRLRAWSVSSQCYKDADDFTEDEKDQSQGLREYYLDAN